MVTTDVDMKSEGEAEYRRDEKKRSKDDARSRSRSRDKEKRRHKKHKKEKKKHRRRERSSDDDTGGEGGETPEKETHEKLTALPGLSKYDSEEEGEIERKKEDVEEKVRGRDRRETSRERRRDASRDRDRRGRDRDSRRDDEKRRRSRSGDRDKRRDDRGRDRRDRSRDRDGSSRQNNEPGEVDVPGQVISLSIEETNKLRAKLGLKPLNVNVTTEETEEEKSLPGELIPGDRDRTRHLVPEHWGERDRTKKLSDRITERREQRAVRGKLTAVKGLGDESSDEDDASKWVEKQRKKVAEKEAAEKRAKAMEQLDEEFGIGELVVNQMKKDQQKQYDSGNLKGLKVGHSAEAFNEKSTILTLADGDILDDKFEDVLTNVNIEDDERTKKSLQNVKDYKEGYKAYDSEVVDELTGEVKKKDLLYQYKEELHGAEKESFKLEADGEYSEEIKKERELAKIRYKLKQQNAVSLETPALQLAKDFFTDAEMAEKASFKKLKKKKKVRSKMLKADDLLAMAADSGPMPEESRKRRRDRVTEEQTLPDGRLPETLSSDVQDDPPPATSSSQWSLEGKEPELPRALLVAQKLKKAKQNKTAQSSVDKVAEEVMNSRRDAAEEGLVGGVDLILDQTAEFCRGLGDVGHWQDMQSSLAGGDADKELLDFEAGLEQEAGARMRSAVEWSKMKDTMDAEDSDRPSSMQQRGTWAEVEEIEVEEGKWKEGARGTKRRHDRSGNENQNDGKPVVRPAILEEEDLAKTGMGAALNMARQKGYLDHEDKKVADFGLKDLKCKDYKIDDKSRKDQEEDDRKRRGGARDRGYGGPTSSFNEKKGYKPQVNLEYIDDSGRALSSKEAFRFLSHKFHGKGSGKLKTEKRFRKVEEEKLMEKMSSTDTPLGTLQKLQRKTRDLATPYLVLSGNKSTMGGHTSLKK